jgi:hypothetical protein
MRTKDLYAREVLRLENKRKDELNMLKSELKNGYEYIRPVNIIKRTLSNAVRSPEIQGDILKIAINSFTGLATKKLIQGDSKSPLKKWLSTFIQSIIGKYVDKNEDGLKLKIEKALLMVLNKINFKKSSSPDSGETDPSGHVSKTAA